MKINSDLNILGSLQDLSLITLFWAEKSRGSKSLEDNHVYTSIKTDASFKRFRRAINGTLLKFNNKETNSLVNSFLSADSVSQDSLLMLFWNASVNNDLLHYLNNKVFFPAYYSGRLMIKTKEVEACIKELRETEVLIKKWSAKTVYTVSYKYLALLKKFNLLEGNTHKKILHPYLSDSMFVLFLYWLNVTEIKPNLLESNWLTYSFCEQSFFIERLMQKKFSKYYQFTYTGDNLKIETLISYKEIYYAVK